MIVSVSADQMIDNVPHLPGIISSEQVLQTARSIAVDQEPSGAIPWFTGGHTDPWDHVESAMGLVVAGMLDEARAAYDWLVDTQRADGSWPMKVTAGVTNDEDTDTNFCGYFAVGVLHYFKVTRDLDPVKRWWPSVKKATDMLVSLQKERGEIPWGVTYQTGKPTHDALVTSCSSLHHAIASAVLLANALDDPQPHWEHAREKLEIVLCNHPEAFTPKERFSMDWYYPVLGGAIRGDAAWQRLEARWTDFVVPTLGIRCVEDRPWVTGAETCELVLALESIDRHDLATQLFADMQHLRNPDGSYGTGLVFADGKRWPEEEPTWTAGVVILAADALTRTTGGWDIYRADAMGLAETPRRL